MKAIDLVHFGKYCFKLKAKNADPAQIDQELKGTFETTMIDTVTIAGLYEWKSLDFLNYGWKCYL
jgi:hypothetical protein